MPDIEITGPTTAEARWHRSLIVAPAQDDDGSSTERRWDRLSEQYQLDDGHGRIETLRVTPLRVDSRRISPPGRSICRLRGSAHE